MQQVRGIFSSTAAENMIIGTARPGEEMAPVSDAHRGPAGPIDVSFCILRFSLVCT